MKEITGTTKTADTKIKFNFPMINRSQSISIGEAIICLIGINQPEFLSKKDSQENIGLMFIDILKHFGISLEELCKMNILEHELDPDFNYQLNVEIKHKIISKTPHC